MTLMMVTSFEKYLIELLVLKKMKIKNSRKFEYAKYISLMWIANWSGNMSCVQKK